MMTEIVLVEGVSDVQLISYFLQNVYEWKHENSNDLGIVPLDKHENIEKLSIIPASEKGALERVIINALNDIPEETGLIQEVIRSLIL